MPDFSPPGALAPLRIVWAAWALALRRLVRSKFMWANLLLAVIPLLIVVPMTIFRPENVNSVNDVHELYEGFLRLLYLHLIVFFMANIFGFAVVRQELDEQTLHYLILQPAPRWTLLAGRFLAYLVLTGLCTVASLWLTYLIPMLARVGYTTTVSDLLGEGRLVILLKESGVLLAGLAAYGAVSMALGSVFRSGMYAIFLLGWEWTLPYLPQVMKHWTVLHYLQSLLPERSQTIGRKMFELLGDPAAPWLCLTVLGGITLLALGGAWFAFQQRQCQYAES